jgi:hypothetical protein
MLVAVYQTIRCHIPKGSNLYSTVTSTSLFLSLLRLSRTGTGLKTIRRPVSLQELDTDWKPSEGPCRYKNWTRIENHQKARVATRTGIGQWTHLCFRFQYGGVTTWRPCNSKHPVWIWPCAECRPSAPYFSVFLCRYYRTGLYPGSARFRVSKGIWAIRTGFRDFPESVHVNTVIVHYRSLSSSIQFIFILPVDAV